MCHVVVLSLLTAANSAYNLLNEPVAARASTVFLDRVMGNLAQPWATAA
jgi:hypothetical protein